MSGKVLNWAARAPVGDVTAKCVLLVLAEASDENGETWIGQETIAERCNVRRETVCGALKRLADRGLISRSKRRRADGYRSSDLIRLTLCEVNSREDNAHEKGSYVRLTGNLMCAKPDSRTLSKNPQIYMSSDLPEGEQTRKAKRTYTEEFSKLWKAYPHFPGRSDKGASQRAWEGLSVEDRAALADAIALFSQTPQAAKNDRQFVKGFHLWIKNDLWRDFVPSVPRADQSEAIDWDRRLTSFKNTSAWPSTWGEKPGRDGCVVPADALARHGLGKTSAPALKVISGGAA